MTFLLYPCLLFYIVSDLSAVPIPKLEYLSPRGFQINVPHDGLIKFLVFHINIDKPISVNDPGEITETLHRTLRGFWTYTNPNVFVGPCIKINYWIQFEYEKNRVKVLGQDPAMEFCKPSQTTVRQKSVCQGQLIFEDSFDTLDLTKWQQEVRIPLDGDFVAFQNRKENCYVLDGKLHIIPTLLQDVPGFDNQSIRTGKLDLGNECTAITDRSQECSRQAYFARILPPVISASIRTRDSFSFRFGKVEVRAKLPSGKWLVPLILLEPVENYYDFKNHESGLVRIFPYQSAGVGLNGVVVSPSERWRNRLNDTDYHIFSFIWRERTIGFNLDQVADATLLAGGWSNTYSMAPFDREVRHE